MSDQGPPQKGGGRMGRALAALAMVVGLALAQACTSKAQAKRQARAAFEAGRLQELSTSAQRQQTLMIRGRVRQPVIPWQPGLTLSRAIALAQYTHNFPPRVISVRRAGVTHFVDMQRWARGTEDPEVLPGDLVELF